ncbi:hypothetical protein DNTS_006738 [Danionella cerebrum]|uniref:Complex I assembly factor TIMMDC1, mitochondrial n=1 Tax=Danionella cerebrum TaxID=2873325 RepID=A0A553QZ95_9TELE|nr:hypothetical protein DNTS_006738 [Danionella translucida]
MFGAVYGGMPAAREARKRFIEVSQADVYQHRAEAVRAVHNAAIRGFIRFGFRWGWRVGVFVTLFNRDSKNLLQRHCAILLHVTVLWYIVAVTGGLFRLNMGLKGLVAGAAIGSVLGIPVGVFILGLQKLGGEPWHEMRQRQKRELYGERIAEWNERLKVTEDLIGQMDNASQQDSEIGQQIEELLNRPAND